MLTERGEYLLRSRKHLQFCTTAENLAGSIPCSQRIGKVGVSGRSRCCGTAVMTLNNPEPAPREVICELNAFICNFFRSLVGDYEATAYHADWPTIHQDLTARHRWLLRWGAENAERVSEDAEWFDAKAAGFWVWGQVHGSGTGGATGKAGDARPQLGDKGTGQGVQIQRNLEDKRPQIEPRGGGSGVSAQREAVPHVKDQMPFAGCLQR